MEQLLPKETRPHLGGITCAYLQPERGDTLSLHMMSRRQMLFGNKVPKKEPEVHLQLFKSHCSSIFLLRSKAEIPETFQHKGILYFFKIFCTMSSLGAEEEKWVINSRSHSWQSIFNQDEGSSHAESVQYQFRFVPPQFVAVRLHFETRTSYLNSASRSRRQIHR